MNVHVCSAVIILESMKGKKSGKKGKSSSNVFSMFEQQQDGISRMKIMNDHE